MLLFCKRFFILFGTCSGAGRLAAALTGYALPLGLAFEPGLADKVLLHALPLGNFGGALRSVPSRGFVFHRFLFPPALAAGSTNAIALQQKKLRNNVAELFWWTIQDSNL